MQILAGILYSNEILFQGFIDGLVYALIAMGLVLIYKATGVINFAQGAIGTFGGFVMGMLMVNYGLPYWLAAILAIAASAAVSTVTELLVVRRLFTKPRLLLFVATLGVAQLVALIQIWLPTVDERVDYPTPIKGYWEIGGIDILLRGEQVTVLIVVPFLVIVLGYLLQKTRFGLAVRSAADNPGAAQLAGISIRSVSTQVWLIAGVLAGVSTLLIGPIYQLDAGGVGSSLGPELLLFSLTAAMFGQLQSFPRALLGGVVIGIINRLVLANKGKGFLDDWGIGNGSNLLAIFLILLLLMLFINRGNKTSEQSWVLTPRLRSAHKDLVQYPLFKWVSRIGIVILALTIIGLPWVVDKPSRLIAFRRCDDCDACRSLCCCSHRLGWTAITWTICIRSSWSIYDVVLYGVIELFSCSRYWYFVGNSRSPHCWHTSVADTWLISRDRDAWVLFGSGTMDFVH